MAIGKKSVSEPKAHVGRKTGKQKTSKLDKEALDAVSRENGKKSPHIRKNSAYEQSAPMELEYGAEDMYADIYDPRAKIAPELKIHAAACFFLTGTVKGAARITGLRHQTISEWKNRAQWWTPVLSKIEKDKNDELDAELTKLLHLTSAEILDRIKDGDSYVTSEYVTIEGCDSKKRVDVLKKKPMSGRDLGALLNTIYDKRTMLRGDPTSITQRKDQSKLLEELKTSMRELAEAAARNEFNKTVISENEEQQ